MDGHSHGHSHDHSVIGPAAKRVRRLLAAIVIPLMIATFVAMAVLWPKPSTTNRLAGPSPAGLQAAEVIKVQPSPCTNPVDKETDLGVCDLVTVQLEGNKRAEFEQSPLANILVRRGDRIYVDHFEVTNPDGKSVSMYSFYEFKRERPLLALGVAFVLVAVVIGRQRGFMALVALAISLLVLARFMLPAIAQGRSPLLVALVGASAVMFLALYLTHGVNARTTSAVIGTIASLGITGLLAAVAVSAARFTGLSDESSTFLRASSSHIDVRGILLAGIIIGALGVLDDVTVTQASAVWELHQADPAMHARDLYRAALRIGRDHIASAVNTLVLAYAGASLPLLLLFSQTGTPLGEVLNGEPVATEIVRMLAGSIGLMASVPITTALTALVVKTDISTKALVPKQPLDTSAYERPAREMEFRNS
jgi:uncharacterized membrane protein